MKDQCWVTMSDIIRFVALLYLSRRLDLLNSIASRKTRRIYVGYIHQPYMRTEVCDTYIQNGRETGISSTEILDKGVRVEKKWLGDMVVSNLDKRLWEFGKLHPHASVLKKSKSSKSESNNSSSASGH